METKNHLIQTLDTETTASFSNWLTGANTFNAEKISITFIYIIFVKLGWNKYRSELLAKEGNLDFLIF